MNSEPEGTKRELDREERGSKLFERKRVSSSFSLNGPKQIGTERAKGGVTRSKKKTF